MLNIGTTGVEAARSLGNNPDWRDLREAILEQTRVFMNRVLEAPTGHRDDAVGYARALRDVYIALESATTGVPITQVKKPGMEKR